MRSNDYLAHHGIKGMRWGVRKDRSSGGSVRGKKKSIPKENSFSKDYYDMKRMSNKELRNAINRMELEKQYSMLVRNDVSNGRRIAQNTLSKVGNTFIVDLAKTAAQEAVKQKVKSYFD